MAIASDEIKTLVEIVGRQGAQLALSRSDKIRAEELLKTAEDLGIRLPKRTPKSEVAIAIVRHVDRRIDKSLDDLKQLSGSEILQYFSEVDPDADEIAELLRSIDIENRIRSHKSLLEFAANQISSLGIFERLAHPSNSIQTPLSPSLQESRDGTESPKERVAGLQSLGVGEDGSTLETKAGVKSDSLAS